MSASQASSSSSSGGPAGLGHMSSLSPTCTPLKHTYDECFQSWFVDYLGVAPPSSSSSFNATSATSPATHKKEKKEEASLSSMWARTTAPKKEDNAAVEESKRRKGLRERLDGQCGAVWEQYRECVRRAVSEKDLDGLIAEARAHNPFPFPHDRAKDPRPDTDPFPFPNDSGR